jgi:GDP-L-fucose synthase
LNGISLLLVNLYGPGDNFDLHTSHVIPALIRKSVEARDQGRECVEVWGTGRATREFLHVIDAARAVQLALEHYNDTDPVNIGSGVEISIAELSQLIVRRTGFAGAVRFDESQPDGQPRRCLDVRRAQELFGFTAAIPLETGLQQTIEWFERTRQRLVAPPLAVGSLLRA